MAIAFQHLVRMPNGDTEITGRGVRVYTILCLQKTGDTPERIAEGYDLPLAAVLEALAYAADYPDEMEAIRKVEADMTREWLSTVLKHLRRDIPKEVLRSIDLP
ncbi:MAG TPA: DUF433 domain-containing protein [Chloroflexota bacterium]|jgi:uncharacterized protein (DUF433 family)